MAKFYIYKVGSTDFIKVQGKHMHLDDFQSATCFKSRKLAQSLIDNKDNTGLCYIQLAVVSMTEVIKLIEQTVDYHAKQINSCRVHAENKIGGSGVNGYGIAAIKFRIRGHELHEEFSVPVWKRETGSMIWQRVSHNIRLEEILLGVLEHSVDKEWGLMLVVLSWLLLRFRVCNLS